LRPGTEQKIGLARHRSAVVPRSHGATKRVNGPRGTDRQDNVAAGRDAYRAQRTMQSAFQTDSAPAGQTSCGDDRVDSNLHAFGSARPSERRNAVVSAPAKLPNCQRQSAVLP
jgi:hypothetical protein